MEESLVIKKYTTSMFKNSKTVKNLIKIIQYEYSATFVSIHWKLDSNYWYVPAILDTCISDEIDTNFDLGWYVNIDIPTGDTIPIRHSKLDHIRYISNVEKTATILINSPLEINHGLDFILEIYVNDLATRDNIFRLKNQHSILLTHISEIIKDPLNNILTICMQNDLDLLNKSSVSLANGIFDIVDLIKLETNKISLNQTLFNVETLIKDISNYIEKTYNVELEIYTERTVPCTVFSDYNRIKQVIIYIVNITLHYNSSVNSILIYISSILVDLNSEDLLNKNNSVQDHNGLYSADYQHYVGFTVSITKDNTLDSCSVGRYHTVNKILSFYPLSIEELADKHNTELRVSALLARALSGEIKCTEDLTLSFNLLVSSDKCTKVKSNTLKHMANKQILLYIKDLDITKITDLFNMYNVNYTVVNYIEEINILYSDKIYDLTIFTDLISFNDLHIIKKISKRTLLIGTSMTNTQECDFILSDLSDGIQIKNKINEALSTII